VCHANLRLLGTGRFDRRELYFSSGLLYNADRKYAGSGVRGRNLIRGVIYNKLFISGMLYSHSQLHPSSLVLNMEL
jgi:hypothetical protein